MAESLQDQLASAFGLPETEAQPAPQQPEPDVQDTAEDSETGSVEPQETEEGGDEAQIESVTDLLKAMEADPEWFYGLKFSYGDGREPITVGELKDSVATLETEKAQLAEQKQAIEAAKAQVQQAFSQAAPNPQASAELMSAQAELMAVSQWINALPADEGFKKLEAENPGEAALVRQKAQDALGQAQGKYQMAQQQEQAITAQRYQAAMAAGMQRLPELIPEWRDPKAMEAEKPTLFEAGEAAGYTRQEVEGVMDPRALVLLRKAAKYDALMKQAGDIKGKVMKTPKMIRPGVAGAGKTVDKRKLQELKKRARRPGARESDKFSAIREATAGLKI